MHDTPSPPVTPAAQADSTDLPPDATTLALEPVQGSALAAPVDVAATASPVDDAPVDAAPADAAPLTPAVTTTATAARDMTPAACAALLKQHFPALFGNQAKPMKLRIQADINLRAPGVFTKAALSAFFRRYTGSTAYLIALGKATQRFDLDGAPAGELTEEHRQLARDELTRRREVTREREQQTRVEAQARNTQERAQARAQEQARQAQHAEQQQARQARGALLRDFERTTLTLANFCALKGLTAEALTPLLEQARKEAAEAPPPRPMADRPPHDMRRDGPRDGPRNGPRDGPRDVSRDGQGDSPRPERAGGRPDRQPGPRPDGAPDQRHDDRNNGPRRDGRAPQRGGARPPAGPAGPTGPSGRGPAR